MIGWSSGLVFEMTGGSMSRGRRRCACGTLAVHVLQRQVDVAREVELDGDDAAALARGGGEAGDALDLHQRLLERLDDVVLDHLRARRPPRSPRR